MLKLYCQKCGCANGYMTEKPNFCQKCGTSFGSLATASDSDEDTQESTSENIPDLTGLEFDIELDKSRTLTIGDIAGTNEQGAGIKLSDNIKDPRTAEEIMKEGSSIRKGGKT